MYVCNFLPKPAESVPGTERTPWYHHQRRLRRGRPSAAVPCTASQMPPGLISPRATGSCRRGAGGSAPGGTIRQGTACASWKVIAIDTRQRLTPSPEVLAGIKAPERRNELRHPYLVAFPDDSGSAAVYGGLAEIVVLECYLLKPDIPSETVLVFMHPIGGGAYYAADGERPGPCRPSRDLRAVASAARTRRC